MNRERIKQVRDLIANAPVQAFAMDTFGKAVDNKNYCGTAFCIGGWACTAAGIKMEQDEDCGEFGLFFEDGEEVDPEGAAAEVLDLTIDEAGWMFYGNWASDKNGNRTQLEHITRDRALAYLDAVLEHDTVGLFVSHDHEVTVL